MENTVIEMSSFLVKKEESSKELANKILNEFMNYRRLSKFSHSCIGINCLQCSLPHLPKILKAVENDRPVTFVLPAFPGKSPNPEKVLGPLPDYAEKLSLHFLGILCRKIKKYYSPGIKIILCSDGRVFSDVVGIKESDVTAYQKKMKEMIKELRLTDITMFNLDDVYSDLSFNQMRDELMKDHGKSLEFLKFKIRNGASDSTNAEEIEANTMYCGITRFLFEDSLHSNQTKSRSLLQKEARAKAYEVIRRSNAWSDLVADLIPDAVRLSIHPQNCGSKKLGIRLIGNESWMTPWHGVAVETNNNFVLLKRSEAEALGAQLILTPEGLPSHFKLTESH